MVLGQVSVVLAGERIAELRRDAERTRLAGGAGRRGSWRAPSAVVESTAALAGPVRQALLAATAQPTTRSRHERTTMLTQHHHGPGLFDAGHCRACARQAGLLDHYWRVQREEDGLRAITRWARQARSYAIWALGASGAGILLAAIALLKG
jgi:hypothetical protein